MVKVLLAAAALGHIICGVTDCMLAYTPDGRFDIKKDTKDINRMKKLFERMPLRQIELSMIIGITAIFMASFGYLSLGRWAYGYSQAAGMIMYISALFFLVLISAHHVLCSAVEWFFVKLGRTQEALENALCFFRRTSAAAAGYVGLLVFDVTLFILILSGNTELPRWACIFNTLIFIIPLIPTRIPAKGNIANALMFLGLLILI